jgi:hypothetical protein
VQVSNASAEAQRALAPFLRSPPLLRIIHTFANQEQGTGEGAQEDTSFDSWATNPQVC